MDRAKFLNAEDFVQAVLHPKSREEHTLTFDCTAKEFKFIKRKLEKLGDRFYAKLSLNTETRTLRVLMSPTPMHQASVTWFTRWADSVAAQSAELEANILFFGEAVVENLLEPLAASEKTADGAVYLPCNAEWPKLALEVGYSEPYDQLKEDVRTLLVGTQGFIGVVVVVKIEPLKPGERTIQKGFVECYEYDGSNPKGIRNIQRLQLFPRPVTHPEMQCIRFDWSDLQSPQYQFATPDSPLPPLRLDSLRELIEKSLVVYLRSKRRL